MMTAVRIAALPACAVLLSVTTLAGAPDVRTLRNLKFSTIAVPGAALTEVAGNNNVGDIVGSYQDANGQGHGFLLRNGVYTTIDVESAILTVLNDINDAGDIVGTYYVDATAGQPFGNVYGFLLTAQGDLTAISYPNERVTWTSGINNRGQIVGAYSQWNGDQLLAVHGFLFDAGTFTPVDFPVAMPRAHPLVTYASGINDAGDIVGGYNEDDIFETRRGFLLQNGTYSQFDVPGTAFTDIFAVNNAGEMVGEYLSDGQVHNFLFRPGRGFYRLAGTGNPKRRFRSILPLNLNDSTHVVGSGSMAGGPLTGFLAMPPAGWQ